MKTFELKAEPRTELGKKSVKALRKEEKIPAVINGGKLVELPYNEALKPGEKLVELDAKRGIITTDIVVKTEDVRKLIYSPDIFEINLEINGETKKAVLKELQFQPVKDTVLHIDFLEVYPDKPIVMEVPVQIEGHAEGVKAGGRLTDLHYEGLELMNAKNAVVCAVQLTRAARGAAAKAAQ